MLLNRLEYALMNNPVRAALQRRVEGPYLLRLGGPMPGGTALEVGCGRGVGVGVILDLFGADSVDGFDLDPRMVLQARRRWKTRAERTRFWVGDACSIPTGDETYDAVFDFGIIHHVPRWRDAVAEVHRVLKSGGRFYAEEVLGPIIRHAMVRRLLEHPQHDRFDHDEFRSGLIATGLEPLESRQLWSSFAWFVARKP